LDPRSLSFTAHNPSVDVLRHAVALDERRAKFVQNLWGALPGQDVEEVWFAGVHCDVGGGYEEDQSALSKIPLQWIVERAKQAGLLIDAAAVAEVIPGVNGPVYVAPNPAGQIHESLAGAWWLAEWLPLPWRVRTADGYETKWHMHQGHPRNVPANAAIHESVYERMRLVGDYRPPNLPVRDAPAPRPAA
jgi:uncharacterized protein (DUF2235 family)